MFTKQDYKRKMSETDTHVYFVGGPFSQWAKSTFTAPIYGTPDVRTFTRAEQYMMATKAALFNDLEALEAIMATDDPNEQKLIGRRIKNFDADIWNGKAREIVYQGNMAKFSQNADLWEDLDGTGEKHLVEGAHYDSIWGVALAWNDPLILDPANWKGTNWLGEVLMRVRRDQRVLRAA